MTEGMRNSGNPKDPDGHRWTAGKQLDAFDYYRPEKFKVLLAYMENEDYTGDILGFGVWDENGPDQRYVLWTDWYGTCSGCDDLEGNNGYEYVKDILRTRTWQFLSIEDARHYFENDFRELNEHIYQIAPDFFDKM